MKTLPDYKKRISKSINIKRHRNNSIHQNFKMPEMSHINLDSHFIYDEKNAILYFNKIINKNLIKPSKEDINYLKDITNKINYQKIISGDKINVIQIPLEYAEKIINFIPKINEESNELVNFVKETIKNNPNRENISCRKLANLYTKKTGKKIGKSTIHKILRKKLNLRYLKTAYKTKRIESDKNKLHSFFFIKAFIKCHKIGFDFIFVDESKIELSNNHFRCWRKNDEQILFGMNNKYKKNLILAITHNDVVYYEILDENTNANIFIKFLEKLKIKMEENKNKKYVLIIDNCSSHKSEEVFEFLTKNKINTLFTPPYQSIFNPIELAFRAFKKIAYSKIYQEINDLINDIQEFLNNDSTKLTLLYNYKETIQQYIHYLDLNNNFNLRNLEMEK